MFVHPEDGSARACRNPPRSTRLPRSRGPAGRVCKQPDAVAARSARAGFPVAGNWNWLVLAFNGGLAPTIQLFLLNSIAIGMRTTASSPAVGVVAARRTSIGLSYGSWWFSRRNGRPQNGGPRLDRICLRYTDRDADTAGTVARDSSRHNCRITIDIAY
jgi:hypothetical protein